MGRPPSILASLRVEIAVSIAAQFYGPASRVFVWHLAQPEELLAANSAVTLVYQLGIALGALAGGALVGTAGAVTGLVVNAASFAVSAVGMTIIGATRQWRERRAIKTAEPFARAGMWRGLAQTARTHGIPAATDPAHDAALSRSAVSAPATQRFARPIRRGHGPRTGGPGSAADALQPRRGIRRRIDTRFAKRLGELPLLLFARTVYVLGAAALVVTAVPSIVLSRKNTDSDARPAR